MGLFDKVKNLADEHADKVEDGLEKVAEVVDEKTGGKHTDKIESAVDKAKDFVGEKGDDGGDGPAEPPSRITP